MYEKNQSTAVIWVVTRKNVQSVSQIPRKNLTRTFRIQEERVKKLPTEMEETITNEDAKTLPSSEGPI